MDAITIKSQLCKELLSKINAIAKFGIDYQVKEEEEEEEKTTIRGGWQVNGVSGKTF